MLEHTDLAARVGMLLVDRGQFVATGESSAGGLISATLLSVPGASAFCLGGAVVYTGRSRGLLFADGELPADVRGGTEAVAVHLATAAASRMRADWGLAETGATGPSGNPYGDPAGHAWVALHRPDGTTRAQHVLTGDNDRAANMGRFTKAAITLLLDELTG
ncbi:MAG: CinA family protein [Acidimicrobiales bacterium]